MSQGKGHAPRPFSVKADVFAVRHAHTFDREHDRATCPICRAILVQVHRPTQTDVPSVHADKRTR